MSKQQNLIAARNEVRATTNLLINARKFVAALEEALDAAPEGTDITGLLSTRSTATARVAELEAIKVQAEADAEASRVAIRKQVTFRRVEWDADDTITAELVPAKFGDSTWEVYFDGELVGTVGSYSGSIDRHAGRIRIPGKERTLWSVEPKQSGHRSQLGYTSRADALRQLYRWNTTYNK